METNPCTDKLTDIEYLEHMIPHHQVAIDMSNRILRLTKKTNLIEFWEKITLRIK